MISGSRITYRFVTVYGLVDHDYFLGDGDIPESTLDIAIYDLPISINHYLISYPFDYEN